MGFLAPWFLAGLAALGVPVFVHLLRRHVTVPRPVGSLMFFERGTQSSTRHRRLRYLLLFALRFALVLLVVLAFANPFVWRSAADANGRLLVIVLDQSFSMRAGTRFADAKQAASRLLAAKPPAQRAQVMALGGTLAVLTQPTADASQLRSALDSIDAGDEHANFGEVGRVMRTLAESAQGPHEPIDLHLFSDMQHTAMPANFADLGLPGNVTLVLHPVVHGAPPPNWTVASVDAPAQLADPKDPKRSRVKAVIAGFHTPAAEKTIALVVNGKVLATRKISVPADGRATVEFAPLDVAYGFNRCEVRILNSNAASSAVSNPASNNATNDVFPADDASVFAVRRSDPERVLFVHAASDIRSPLYYGAALGAAAQSSFVLQSVTTEQTSDLDPSKFAFVVLSNAGELPKIFERALDQYVAKGGSLLIALGLSAGHHAPIPVWGDTVEDTRNYARVGATASVAQVDFTHPALEQAQPGPDRGGWAEAKFYYAAVVDPGNAADPTSQQAHASGQTRVVARLSDGTPLILDRQIGEGHVLLFTSGLDNLTNDLPLHPVFVAFIDRAAQYLSGSARLGGSRLVDSYVQLRSAGEPLGQIAQVEVVDPDGRRPLSLQEARTAQSFALVHSGFYQVHFANGRDAVLGVNPDRRESDLESIPPDVQQLWSGSTGPASAVTNAPTAAMVGAPQIHRVSLWWYVMLLALIVAMAETVLATRYMGKQREAA